MLCTEYKGKYLGKKICGLMPGNVYEFELSNNERTYELNVTRNVTEDKVDDITMQYASEISIKQNWKILE